MSVCTKHAQPLQGYRQVDAHTHSHTHTNTHLQFAKCLVEAPLHGHSASYCRRQRSQHVASAGARCGCGGTSAAITIATAITGGVWLVFTVSTFRLRIAVWWRRIRNARWVSTVVLQRCSHSALLLSLLHYVKKATTGDRQLKRQHRTREVA